MSEIMSTSYKRVFLTSLSLFSKFSVSETLEWPETSLLLLLMHAGSLEAGARKLEASIVLPKLVKQNKNQKKKNNKKIIN